ncbi:MAG: hypothetical protein ACI8VE_002930, partial [Natrialbaceae archaeon]
PQSALGHCSFFDIHLRVNGEESQADGNRRFLSLGTRGDPK